MHPVGPAGQDKKRGAVGLEHQAVRDRPGVAAERCRGGIRGRHRFRELSDVTRHACGLEQVPDAGCGV